MLGQRVRRQMADGRLWQRSHGISYQARVIHWVLTENLLLGIVNVSSLYETGRTGICSVILILQVDYLCARWHRPHG
jgi:hypothetical protein